MTVDTDSFVTQRKDVVVFDQTEKGLAELEERFGWDDEKLDSMLVHVEEQEVVKGAKKTLTSLRTDLENVKKEAKKPYLDAGKAIEDKYKEVLARVKKIEAPIDAAIARRKKADDDAAKAAQAKKDAEKDARIAELEAQLKAAGQDIAAPPEFEPKEVVLSLATAKQVKAAKELFTAKVINDLLIDSEGQAYELKVTVSRSEFSEG
ncbi:hypothetical protein ABMA68_16315 [Halobacteriovorax sp. FRX-2]|uniref:hypothetical protein n=2 Tax=unclassified Halobacteriovorax TaxID=2639665 RepID=UPI003715D161